MFLGTVARSYFKYPALSMLAVESHWLRLRSTITALVEGQELDALPLPIELVRLIGQALGPVASWYPLLRPASEEEEEDDDDQSALAEEWFDWVIMNQGRPPW